MVFELVRVVRLVRELNELKDIDFVLLRLIRVYSWAEESREQSTPPLPYAALKAHTEELLGFNGKLHRELIDDFLGIAIDDEIDGVFGGDAALVAIEELIF